MAYIITSFSDTHQRHLEIKKDLPGGNILLCSGDMMNSGYQQQDVVNFCKWYDAIDNYDLKVFIAGNHDRLFENLPDVAAEIVNSYKWITYLQDDWVKFQTGADREIKIYGTPWQPWFHGWAFNLQRNGPELAKRWADIPDDADIVLTHGPQFDILDKAGYPFDGTIPLGCELLRERMDTLKPRMHVFGHIHGGYGMLDNDNQCIINASVVNEQYNYAQKPITVSWDTLTDKITRL